MSYLIRCVFSPQNLPPKITLRLSTTRSNGTEPAKYTFLITGCVSSHVTTYEAGNAIRDQLYTLVTLPPVPTGWEGGWSLISVVKRKYFYPFRVLRPGHSTVSPTSACNKQKIIVSEVCQFASNEFVKRLMQISSFWRRPTLSQTV